MTASQDAPKQGHYNVRGLKLSYLEWGDADASPLVMLHGGLENAHAWGPVASRLGRGWRIIAPDLRGHGDSEWAPGADYATLDFVSDLAALFVALELESAMLTGHSLGGAVATHFAALYPQNISRLCIVEGLRPAGQSRPATPDERMTAIREWSDKIAEPRKTRRPYSDVSAMVDRLCAADPLMPRAMAEHLVPLSIRPCKGGYRWKYDPRVRDMAILTTLTPEPEHFWRRITCSTLMIYGQKSWAADPSTDGRLDYFQDGRVEIIADAGHNVHHHQPDAFVGALQSFIADS